MMIRLKTIAFLFFLLMAVQTTIACSMYKLTVDGKTMVGNNEDAWRTASVIWFETGASGEFGACYTGSRQNGPQQYAAQSGMNEMGLTFSRLASHYPKNDALKGKNKKTIQNQDDFLKQALHRCKTVEDVRDYFTEYDHSVFLTDIFIFVEKSGRYLIVEPYLLTIGEEENYVLSNFCPSITPEEQRRNLDRYRKGVDFVETGAKASLAFCTAMSDEMHVCREKIGDGTLLTAIWDTQGGKVNLFFYHDYSHTVSFNVAEELSKGDHQLDITTLFPKNEEFEMLGSYVTPFNTPLLRIGMAIIGFFFFCSSIFFTIGFLRKRRVGTDNTFKVLLAAVCLVMSSYMYVLATNMNAFYFSAPYEHFDSTLISASSYVPFLLLLFIIPAGIRTLSILRKGSWNPLPKLLLVANNSLFAVLILSFAYWGFYNVF